MSKMLEVHINNKIRKYLEKLSLIDLLQHGFRKHKSTTVIEEIAIAFDQRDLAQITFCDLIKVFDMVAHCSLLSKL